MKQYVHRVLALAATEGRRLALVLVLVGLLVAGGTAWHAASPTHETVTETTTVDAATTEVATSALVTGNSSFYADGERVEGAPVYLLDPAPELTLRATAQVPADRDVVVSQRLVLSYVATHDETTFWESNRTVARGQQVATDGTADLTGTLDVAAVDRQLDEYNDELRGGGTVDARLVHVTTYRVDGHEHTLRSSAPLRITDGAYTVGGPLAASHDHTTESTDRRLVTTGHFATTVGGHQVVVDDAALVGALLAALAWVGAGATLRYGSRIDPATARRRVTVARYAEWISAGRLPATHDGPAVRLGSLPDLVDVAIDTRGRVVHDRTRGVYAVFDGDRAYFVADGAVTGWDEADGTDADVEVPASDTAGFDWGGAEPSRVSDAADGAPSDD